MDPFMSKAQDLMEKLELLFPNSTFSVRGRRLKVHAGSEIDGLPVFNFLKVGADDEVYEFGVHKKLMSELELNGYFAEIHESGDLFCSPAC